MSESVMNRTDLGDLSNSKRLHCLAHGKPSDTVAFGDYRRM